MGINPERIDMCGPLYMGTSFSTVSCRDADCFSISSGFFGVHILLFLQYHKILSREKQMGTHNSFHKYYVMWGRFSFL